MNSKVYDGRVSFTAESNYSMILEAYLSFIPRIYLHLPREAFPNETIRDLSLIPVDGKFDEKIEEFLANITGITGGREHDIVITIKDTARNVATASLTTPYIREFENIAPLDDIQVGAYYYSWYNKGDPWFNFWFNSSEWRSLGYKAQPLLGQYRSDDPIIISKHIDWATGHGIDYFLIGWGYAGGPGGFNDKVLKDLKLKNPLISQIKFCILYESGGRLIKNEEGEFNLTYSENVQQLLKDFNYFADNYFSHPSYLEIDGKTAVFFDASRFFVGDVQGVLKEVREAANKKGYQVYLMCDALGNFLPPTDPKMVKLLESFDAVTANDMWVNNYGDPDARRDFISYTDQILKLWKLHAKEYGKSMVPSINPRWEPYLYYKLFENFNAPFLERNPERYKKLLSIALNYSEHIIVGHFNEFFAHNHIEPDTKNNFQYLLILKNVLTSYTLILQLDWDSIIMLIGDLDDRGPNPVIKSQLLGRIDLAARSGVDTILIVFRTSSVEDTFSEIDSIIEYAAKRNITVIPRIVVNSKKFTEFIVTRDDILPDYTNKTQLEYAVNLLRKVILHLEGFPNIVAYQIEWGHYGESWINSPFWNTVSSNMSFVNYLKSISPAFKDINPGNFANWITGDIMYYSEYLPKEDPRRSQMNVAVFYWYQEWRNTITLNITWTFRSVAKQLTEKPVLGFSYTGVNSVAYVYSAHRYLDAAFSDAAPNVYYSPNKNFIRDAYFRGLHLGELDFDTPYFSLTKAEEAIVGMYSRGIIPVIFHPLWSRALKDTNIPVLVNYMKKYSNMSRNPIQSEILLVVGRNDIGFHSFEDQVALAHASGPWISIDPPGLIAILEAHKLKYDIIDPEVYSPDIGNAYKVVIVFVPRDTFDHAFIRRLEKTNTSILIMHPSFMVGTPTKDNPIYITSAVSGMWNPLIVKSRKIEAQVYGTPPGVDVVFLDKFSNLGRIEDYIANHLFSHYNGNFDSVYAITELGHPVVVRIENIIFFGLDTHVKNQTHRNKVESFFIEILKSLDIELQDANTPVSRVFYWKVSIDSQDFFTQDALIWRT